jgi:hypothetical protein
LLERCKEALMSASNESLKNLYENLKQATKDFERPLKAFIISLKQQDHFAKIVRDKASPAII